MIDYVFTRAYTLERIPYQPGDEIQRTPRLGDWLIAQGIPLRRKDGQPLPPPVVAKLLQPPRVAPASPRWSCCGRRPQ